MPRPRGRPKKLIDNSKCHLFSKSDDGFCTHYTGSCKMISSCFDNCDLDERHKPKRFK